MTDLANSNAFRCCIAGPEIRDEDERADASMRRGIALLESEVPGNLKEAVACFEEAIRLRGPNAARGGPWTIYGWAAGWMNRGDALTRMGKAEFLPEARRSYDRALVILHGLPPGAHPLFRRRHVIAWMNRGQTLMRFQTSAGYRDALYSFEQSLGFLKDRNLCEDPEFDGLVAASRLNRAAALLRISPPRPRETLDEARDILRESQADDPTSAEMVAKARQLVCQAVAHLVEDPSISPVERVGLLDEATDQVEAGLRETAHWACHSHRALQAVDRELFRFGAFAYWLHQPRFLAEFLEDHLDGEGCAGGVDAGRRQTLREILRLEWARIWRGAFPSWDSPENEFLLAQISLLGRWERRDTVSPVKVSA